MATPRLRIKFGKRTPAPSGGGCNECDCIAEIFKFEDDFCGAPYTTDPANDNLVWQIFEAIDGNVSLDSERTDGWWAFTLQPNDGDGKAQIVSRGKCLAVPAAGQGTLHFRASVFMNIPLVAPAVFEIGLAINIPVSFIYNPSVSPFWQVVVGPNNPVMTTVPVSTSCTTPDKLEFIANSATIQFKINGQTVASIPTPASQLTLIHGVQIVLANPDAILAQTVQMQVDYVCVSKKRFCRFTLS